MVAAFTPSSRSPFKNTIIGNNSAETNPDVAGTFTSRGHNAIGNTTGSAGWIATDKTNANATPLNLTALINNGGPTDTHAPQPGSILIEGGSFELAKDPGPNRVAGDGDDVPIGTDQRGYPRKIGSEVDIGAVEFDPPQPGPSFVVTTTHEHADGVCGIGDCSLWDAVNASNGNTANNSSITFVPALTGTITVTLQNGGMVIARPVSITGPGADQLAISGAGVNRIFNVTTTGAFSLSNLTLRDARWSSGDGAALRVPNAVTTISGCRFIDNATSANWSGGAIYTLGQLNISNTEFGANKGGSGGAVYPRFGSVVTINGCDFHDNEAIGAVGSGLGAALLLWDGPTATVTNCTFRNNKAQAQGGAAYVLQNSTLNVSNSTFSGNTVPFAGRGGAIVNDGTTTLTGVTFTANSTPSGDGGAIYNRGTCTLTNATLSENLISTDPTTPGTAGGIYNLSGSLTLTNVTLNGNVRGGIHRQGGTVTLTNTALAVGPVGANCSGFTGGTACFSDDNSCGSEPIAMALDFSSSRWRTTAGIP